MRHATRFPALVRTPDARPIVYRPASATDLRIASVALVSLLASLLLLRRWHVDDDTAMLVLLAAIAIPAASLELAVLKVHRRPTTGLDWDAPFRLDVPRVLTKLLGLATTLGVIGLAFWVFPEYRGAFFAPFFRALGRNAGLLAVVAVAYVALVDGRMREPRDAYWQLGRCVLGHPGDADRGDLADHARSWLVKAFFLPLMVTYLHGSTARIVRFDLSGATWENLRLYEFVHDGAFLVDLAFATVGYVFSVRAADTHVRSAERTMAGWVVALLCYQPFFSLFDAHYLAYGGPGFGALLARWPAVRAIWAGAIIALVAVYVAATVSFGLRFSNLTHRGILTNGPYRFTKHPAYLAKNLSWWLASVPFAVAGGGEAVRHVLMLLALNAIYFLRARTEERHLSEDPRYVAYALWIEEHGVLRHLGRWIPFLRYVPPVAAHQDELAAARTRAAPM